MAGQRLERLPAALFGEIHGIGDLGGSLGAGRILDTAFELDAAPGPEVYVAFLTEEPIEAQDAADLVDRWVTRGEADDVGIVGDMIGFRREDPMTRLDGTDVFYYSTRLEPDAAVTYGFIPDYGEPVPDPIPEDQRKIDRKKKKEDEQSQATD